MVTDIKERMAEGRLLKMEQTIKEQDRYITELTKRLNAMKNDVKFIMAEFKLSTGNVDY